MFFVQAEDAIRDWSVTGVQTCALPIFRLSRMTGCRAWSSVMLSLLAALAPTMSPTMYIAWVVASPPMTDYYGISCARFELHAAAPAIRIVRCNHVPPTRSPLHLLSISA